MNFAKFMTTTRPPTNSERLSMWRDRRNDMLLKWYLEPMAVRRGWLVLRFTQIARRVGTWVR